MFIQNCYVFENFRCFPDFQKFDVFKKKCFFKDLKRFSLWYFFSLIFCVLPNLYLYWCKEASRARKRIAHAHKSKRKKKLFPPLIDIYPAFELPTWWILCAAAAAACCVFCDWSNVRKIYPRFTESGPIHTLPGRAVQTSFDRWILVINPLQMWD